MLLMMFHVFGKGAHSGLCSLERNDQLAGAQDSRLKKLYCPFKNGNFSSVTHQMTVIKTSVNHIGPTVVNTQ